CRPRTQCRKARPGPPTAASSCSSAIRAAMPAPASGRSTSGAATSSTSRPKPSPPTPAGPPSGADRPQRGREPLWVGRCHLDLLAAVTAAAGGGVVGLELAPQGLSVVGKAAAPRLGVGAAVEAVLV